MSKIKNIFFYLFNANIAAILVCFVFLPGCKKYKEEANKIYFSQAANSPVVRVVVEDGSGSVSISAASTFLTTKDVTGKVEIQDSAYLENYNKYNFTEYKIIPASAVTLSTSEVMLLNGTAIGDKGITVTVKEWPGYVAGKQYAVPIKIKSPDLPGLSGADFVLIEITKVVVSSAPKDGRYEFNYATILGKTKGDPLDNFTVEGRFNLTKALFVAGNWRADLLDGCGMQFLVQTSGAFNIRFPNSAFMGTSGSTTTNSWFHAAITYSKGIASLYIDGNLIGQTPYPGLTVSDWGSISGYAAGCGCIVSEVRVWKTTRTVSQLKNYACAVDPSDPDLAAYWKFNEASGKEINDVTGHGNTLTSTTNNVIWVPSIRCPQ